MDPVPREVFGDPLIPLMFPRTIFKVLLSRRRTSFIITRMDLESIKKSVLPVSTTKQSVHYDSELAVCPKKKRQVKEVEVPQ